MNCLNFFSLDTPEYFLIEGEKEGLKSIYSDLDRIRIPKLWNYLFQNIRPHENQDYADFSPNHARRVQIQEKTDIDLQQVFDNYHKTTVPHIASPRASRVYLSQGQFIHANRLQTRKGTAFIAAQMPNTESIQSFWQMLAQERVKLFVNLTNDEDREDTGIIVPYWPEFGDSMEISSDLSVEYFKKIKLIEGLSIRFFNLIEADGSEREIRMVHSKLWHNASTPSTPLDFDILLDTIEKIWKSFAYDSPLAIHSRAGVGRAGAVIESLELRGQINRLLSGDPLAQIPTFQSISKDILHLRSQRDWQIVQTPDQLGAIITSTTRHINRILANSIN